MSAPHPLPLDFIIIGAPKSATTWLAHCLREHPQVFLPLEEFHYFSRHFDPQDPLPETFTRHFQGRGPDQIVGERSNTYLSDPQAIQRIAQYMPQAKLVAMLRNPIERAYSDYCMLYRRGQVSADIAAHLDPERAPETRFLNHGLYAQQLEHLREHVRWDQVHVMIQDDVKTDPAALFEQLCRFLDVDPTVQPPMLHQRTFTREQSAMPPVLRRVAGWGGVLTQRVRQSNFYRKYLRSAVMRRLDYPQLDDGLRQKLIAYYRRDIEHVSQLVHRDLSHWAA